MKFRLFIFLILASAFVKGNALMNLHLPETAVQKDKKESYWAQALKLSQDKNKSLLFAFVSSKDNPWSEKWSKEVLSQEEFLDAVKNDFVYITLDNPSDAEEYSFLKDKFHINELPLLVLVDSEGEEISKVAYMPLAPKELADHLKGVAKDYKRLKKLLHSASLLAVAPQKLKEYYTKAGEAGCEHLKQKLLEAGLQTDPSPFFLLEKYAQHVEKGERKSPEMRKIKERILKADPKNEARAHLTLALLDFKAKQTAPKPKQHIESVLKPLLNYLAQFGSKDADNRWKLELMAADYLFRMGREDDALHFAKKAFESAPHEEKIHVAQKMDSFQMVSQPQ